MRVGDVIRRRATERPEAVALRHAERELTYGELDERSNRLGQALLASGVGAGTRVAYLDRSSPEVVELLLRREQGRGRARTAQLAACATGAGGGVGGLAGAGADRRPTYGYLFLTDRIKAMIVSGGENVYPVEVEEALAQHADVADVAVVGVPDAHWGEAIKALIVRRPGARPAPDNLIAFARERLAGYKLPRSVDFVDELPRTPSGKVLKRELRERYAALRSGDELNSA
jgi:acyl-CoA synthetase (AMP-forming)/AMP-acid ligase II